MSLNINNSVSFHGKNLNKLNSKKDITKMVDKLGFEVPEQILLSKRPKAEQMEVVIQKSAKDPSFIKLMKDILGITK